MRAIFYDRVGQPLQLVTMDVPEPGPGQVVIKVARCGICGSDATLTRVPGFYPEQSVIGHEYAGEIVALGTGVEGFATGDRITAMPCAGCGTCHACVEGVPLHCPSPSGDNTGGFAEYMTVSTVTAVKLPQTLALADAALVEPLSVGLHGAALAAIRPGERVLVIGAGAVALAAIYWLKRLGAGRIVAMSRSRKGERIALAMGADAFVQAGPDEIGEVQEALGGMPDVVAEAIGVPGALDRCVNHVVPNGRIVSLGFATSPDPVNVAVATFKQPQMMFSLGYTMREFAYCADTMNKGHVDPAMMVTKTIPLGEVPAVISAMQEGRNPEVKIHADPSL